MKKICFDELVLDGAMGSLILERSGQAPGYSPEKLNIENPEAVKSVHRDYLDAGAQMLYTNTFGANSFKLKGEDSVEKVVKAAVDIALSAGEPDEYYTALDIGPLGKVIGNDITFDDAVEEFKRIILAANDRTDALVIETMTDLRELRAALLAAEEFSALPVMASMSFNEKGFTFFGNNVKCFVTLCENLGVKAVGANCSLGPYEMQKTAEELVKYSSLPVFLKPNAGMPVLQNGATRYLVGPLDFAEKAADFRDLGISVLGGCCGTTPEHIRMLAQLKNGARRPRSERVERLCSAQVSTATDRITSVAGIKITDAEDLDEITDNIFETLEESPDALAVDLTQYTGALAKLPEIIELLCQYVKIPLVFDAADAEVQRTALRYYHGIAGIIPHEELDGEAAEKYGAVEFD